MKYGGERKLAFWGTGNVCRQILKFHPEIRPRLFIDSNPGKAGGFYQGVPVCHPKEMVSWTEYFIVLALDHISSVKGQLMEAGLEEGQDFAWYRDWLFSPDLPSLLREAEDFIEGVEKDPQRYAGKNLVFSDMLAFDKGACDFIETWDDRKGKLLLMSEVGWIFEDMAQRNVEFQVKRLPMLFSHHQYVKKPHEITLPYDAMKACTKKREYVREAAEGFRLAYPDMAEDYEHVICFHGERFLRKIMECWVPSAVTLWNAFYPFHHLIRGVCREMGVPVLYMEFGNIPGTITIERMGQMGESWPARYSREFREMPVSRKEIQRAEQRLSDLKASRRNRNVQPEIESTEEVRKKLRNDRSVVLYVGSHDYASGIQPYTNRSKIYHSPMFQSSDEGAVYLSSLCRKKGWNFVYKPHPMMMQWFDPSGLPADAICVDEVDIHDLIDMADVVATILSTVSYTALIRGKPVVMMGYTQLTGKGCTYEAFRRDAIEEELLSAIRNQRRGFMERMFLQHLAQMERYYEGERIRICS